MKYIPDVSGMSLEDAVREYCKAGAYLVPVRTGKHPGSSVGKGWPEKSSNDPDVVLEMLRSTGAEGIALHVGKSGLVAFDVDTPAALPELIKQHLDKAPHQRTRADDPVRGHYLFGNDGVDYSNSLGSLPAGWGDIRGRNGVIILQPSPHPKPAGEYAWVRTGKIPTLPDDLAMLMTRAADKAQAAGREDVNKFISEHSEGTDLAALDYRIYDFRNAVADGESRHQSMLVALANAMTEAKNGLYPAEEAVSRLAEEFQEALGGERDAYTEFMGMVAWAVAQAQREEVSVNEVLAGAPVETEPVSESITGVMRKQRTHTGSMYRLAERFRGRFLWSPHTKWYAWSPEEGRWREDAEHLVRQAIIRELPEIVQREVDLLIANGVDGKEIGKHKKYLFEVQCHSHQKAVLEMLQTQLLVDWEDFDADLNKLTVGNGTLHFDRGNVVLKPHNPEDRITRGTSVNYVPGAKAPFWEATLERFLPDPEVRAFLQRFAGSILVGGGVREQVLPIMFGTGANGKSTFVNGIRAALGEELAIEVDPATLRQDNKSGSAPSPDKMRLRGARYVYAVEATGHLDAQLLKRFTGGEEIVARPLHGKTISFRPNFTLTIIANEEPEFDDSSEGLWRRIKRIPFDVRIPDEERMDAVEVQKLFEEQAEGILAWCVEGYKEYARMGLTPPACVEISSKRMREDADPVRRFVMEHFVKDEEGVVKPSDAYKLWREWIHEEDPRADAASMGATKWKQHVTGILGTPHDGRTYVDGKRVRGWVGYRLSDEEESTEDLAAEPVAAAAGRKDEKAVPATVFPRSGTTTTKGTTERTEISGLFVQEPRVVDGLPPTVDFSTGQPSADDAPWRRLYRDKKVGK